MHLNAIFVSFTFLMEPGLMQLISLHSKTPSLSTSKKLSASPDVLIGSLVISLIHSSDSAASSSLYFELIWNKRKEGTLIRSTLGQKCLQSRGFPIAVKNEIKILKKFIRDPLDVC